MTSTPYAHASPKRVMTTPATAGPISAVLFHTTWFRAIAEGSSSGLSRRGVIAARVGESIAETPAMIATPAYTSATGGGPLVAPPRGRGRAPPRAAAGRGGARHANPGNEGGDERKRNPERRAEQPEP